MLARHFRLFAAGLLIAGLAALAHFASAGCIDWEQLASDAVSEKAEIAKEAIADLRAFGPRGLESLLAAHGTAIEKQAKTGNLSEVDGAAWKRIKAAVDAVGGQYDCHTSQLYWYTDLEAAKAVAQKTEKPILSLRLLGNLTEECSCANSRFFRSTLYANAEVSRVLREKFVLHWQSVRPVPKVTIDFGDGRKLERTVTGNSIHYVLTSDGLVIDALPGLYGPKAFLRGIEEAGSIAKFFNTAIRTREQYLRDFHRDRSSAILSAWQNDLKQLGLLAADAPGKPVAQAQAAAPKATRANNKTSTKRELEARIVADVLVDAGALSSATDDAVWGQIAALHHADAELDAASRALIKAQNPGAARAGGLAIGKSMVETPLLRMLRNLQNSIAIDTVRNEYTLHRQIHDWFAAGEVPLGVDVNELNDRVYAQLFLTPRTDPWLGLLPDGVYSALDNNGLVQQ